MRQNSWLPLLLLGTSTLITGCQPLPPQGSGATRPSQPGAPALPASMTRTAIAPLPAQALAADISNVPVSQPADTSHDVWSYKLASLETMEAEIVPGASPKARVTVHGLLHDGATRINEVQQERLGNNFVLTVTTARARTAVASVALIPFERTVTLDLGGIPPGPCRISANGISTTLVVP